MPLSTHALRVERHTLDALWDAIELRATVSAASGALWRPVDRDPRDPRAHDESPWPRSRFLRRHGAAARGGFRYGDQWELRLPTPDRSLSRTYRTSLCGPRKERPTPKVEIEFFPADSVGWTTCEGNVPELSERVLTRGDGPRVVSRLLRVAPGTDTSALTHNFWEEVMHEKVPALQGTTERRSMRRVSER